MKNSNTAERLKYIMETRNLKQVDIVDACQPFCKKYGVKMTKSSMSHYVNGTAEPSQIKLIILGTVLGVDETWLMGYDVPQKRQTPTLENIIPLNFKRVPVLGSIACGEPIFAEQGEGGYVDANEDSDADFALICRGDSMIGDDIRDGDYVMIRRQEMVDNGEIACVLIGDEATLKHFYFNNGVVTLTAANQKYPPMVFTGYDIDTIRILGKAVGLTRFF